MPARPQRRVRRDDRLQLGFLEAVARRCPDDERVLEALGELYTRVGRFAEGLAIDLQLTRRHPAVAHCWYNLGCSYSLLGRADEAFAALERAVALGYQDVEWLRRDADLAPLRSDPRFRALLAQLARA